MNAIEIVYLCLIAGLCFVCTKSDISEGLIRNKVLLLFFALSLPLNIYYYGIYAPELRVEFILNLVIMCAISLYLFFSHIFAGGDSKMLIVLAFLYPAGCYVAYAGNTFTLFFAICFAILAGFIYLLANSIYSIVSRKVEFTFDYVKDYIKSFLKTYIAAVSFIAAFNCVVFGVSSFGISVNAWIVRLLGLTIALMVGRFKVLRKPIVVICVIIITAIVSLIFGFTPISLNPENYALVFVLVICQMTIKTTIYETITISELKKGMILSTFSSLMFQMSITKGLPPVSKENLNDRLTEEQVASVQKWAKATRTQSITIVKKIPFAVFITIGFAVYFVVWRILL